MRPPQGPPTRQAKRIAVRLSAEINYDGEVYTATTRDLSTGGVCLESTKILDEGATLIVGLFLVDDDVEDASQPPFELEGSVAWAAPSDDGGAGTMGIRFENVSATQQKGLNRFLQLLPQAG